MSSQRVGILISVVGQLGVVYPVGISWSKKELSYRKPAPMDDLRGLLRAATLGEAEAQPAFPRQHWSPTGNLAGSRRCSSGLRGGEILVVVAV